MCRQCLLEVRPERLRTALDGGSYLLNFKACGSCHKRGFIREDDHCTDIENEETEIVTYSHYCMYCSHRICEHFYSFTILGTKQHYTMDCVLCGTGNHVVNVMTESSVSVDPAEQRAKKKAGVLHEAMKILMEGTMGRHQAEGIILSEDEKGGEWA